MRLKRYVSLLVLGLVLATAAPVYAQAETVSDVAERLICMCGCTLLLQNCTHAECAVRESMTAFVRDKLDEGLNGGQIVQLLVAQYGEEVLSTPPKRGFNLVAWLLPFAGILLFAGIIYAILTKWVRRGEQLQGSEVVNGDEIDEEYRARLEKELSEFSERSFR